MLRKTISIFIGSTLLSIGLNGFVIPYHLLDGGVIGISLIVKYLWGFHAGLVIILLSLPIYSFALFFYRSLFFNGIHGLLISSFFIDLFTPIKHLFHVPPIISCTLGGILIGCGIGIMLRNKVSTGGSDLLAIFISQKTSINVGIIIFTIDALVLFAGYETIGINLLYSALTIGFGGLTTSIINIHRNEDEVLPP